MSLRWILSLVSAWGLYASAAPNAQPSIAEFMRFCRAHRLNAQVVHLSPLKAGTIDFLPTAGLDGNQGRYSWPALAKKIAKAVEADTSAYVDSNKDQWIFGHDHGRSLYPITDPIQGIFYRGRVHIVDGHHHALGSTYMGAETIPVEIISDMSTFSPKQFEEYLDGHWLSYLRDSNGEKTKRVDLCEMLDDPNLELARLLFVRVDVKYKDGHLVVNKVKGPNLVIGVKIGSDISFLEFELADALRTAGIVWIPGQHTETSEADLAKYLKVLKAAAKQPGSRLRQVLLLDEPSVVAELDLTKLIRQHLGGGDCEIPLLPTSSSPHTEPSQK